jgi:uncharacterized protein YhbP (UPF0306 family)
VPERTEVEVLREDVISGCQISLATISDSQSPRAVVVWYASDDDLSLVFISQVSRRHSADIREFQMVAGTILKRSDLTESGPGTPVRGVMFRGIAEETSGTDLDRAYKVYAKRWPQVESLAPLEDVKSGSNPNRFYRIRPTTFTLFDEPLLKPQGRDALVEFTQW